MCSTYRSAAGSSVWNKKQISCDFSYWIDIILLFSTYLLTYLVSYSMKQSPSWEANRFSATQEIPRILWKHNNIRPPLHKFPGPVTLCWILTFSSASQAIIADVAVVAYLHVTTPYILVPSHNFCRLPFLYRLFY